MSRPKAAAPLLWWRGRRPRHLCSGYVVDLVVDLVDVGLVDVVPAVFSRVQVGVGVWGWGTLVTSCIFCDFSVTRVS